MVDDAAPEDEEYVPPMQLKHAANTDAPVDDEYVPAAQLEHVVAPLVKL